MFKVNIRNSRKRYEICSKLTLKAQKWCQWLRSSVFIVNFWASVSIVDFEKANVSWWLPIYWMLLRIMLLLTWTSNSECFLIWIHRIFIPFNIKLNLLSYGLIVPFCSSWRKFIEESLLLTLSSGNFVYKIEKS